MKTYKFNRIPDVFKLHNIVGLFAVSTDETDYSVEAVKAFPDAKDGDEIIVSVYNAEELHDVLNDNFVTMKSLGDNKWEIVEDKFFEGERSALAYSLDSGTFIEVSEGDGSNLSSEDIDKGYVDYVYIRVLSYTGEETLKETDGGQLMLTKPFEYSYDNITQVINDAVVFMYGDKTQYLIIKKW